MTRPNSTTTFTFPGTDLTVRRTGYGAMRLTGPGISGPPTDLAAARQVLHDAIDAGVNHIDTSDFYGPHVNNELIRDTLRPYPDDLVIVTKVDARRDAQGVVFARSPEQLRIQVQENLKHLGLDTLSIVNLRLGSAASGHAPEPGSLAEPFSALAQMQQEGLIQQLGLSNVNVEQVREAQGIAPVVGVQNLYNVVQRRDDALMDELARQGIAYVPYFPLGGFSPLQSGVLDEVATSLNASPLQVALAWLLQRSPNILLIPGTSSPQHLKENMAAAELRLAPEALERLNSLATLAS